MGLVVEVNVYTSSDLCRLVQTSVNLEAFQRLPWAIPIVITRAGADRERHRDVRVYESAHDPPLRLAVAGEDEPTGACSAQRF
jgi:hypothetical protein